MGSLTNPTSTTSISMGLSPQSVFKVKGARLKSTLLPYEGCLLNTRADTVPSDVASLEYFVEESELMYMEPGDRGQHMIRPLKCALQGVYLEIHYNMQVFIVQRFTGQVGRVDDDFALAHNDDIAELSIRSNERDSFAQWARCGKCKTLRCADIVTGSSSFNVQITRATVAAVTSIVLKTLEAHPRAAANCGSNIAVAQQLAATDEDVPAMPVEDDGYNQWKEGTKTYRTVAEEEDANRIDIIFDELDEEGLATERLFPHGGALALAATIRLMRTL